MLLKLNNQNGVIRSGAIYLLPSCLNPGLQFKPYKTFTHFTPVGTPEGYLFFLDYSSLFSSSSTPYHSLTISFTLPWPSLTLLSTSYFSIYLFLSSFSAPPSLSLSVSSHVSFGQKSNTDLSPRHLFEAPLPLCEIPDKETALASVVWGNDIWLAMKKYRLTFLLGEIRGGEHFLSASVWSVWLRAVLTVFGRILWNTERKRGCFCLPDAAPTCFSFLVVFCRSSYERIG